MFGVHKNGKIITTNTVVLHWGGLEIRINGTTVYYTRSRDFYRNNNFWLWKLTNVFKTSSFEPRASSNSTDKWWSRTDQISLRGWDYKGWIYQREQWSLIHHLPMVMEYTASWSSHAAQRLPRNVMSFTQYHTHEGGNAWARFYSADISMIISWINY